MTRWVRAGYVMNRVFHVELGPDDRVVKADRSLDPQTINTR